jgi:Flp pilus assembly protein TadD
MIYHASMKKEAREQEARRQGGIAFARHLLAAGRIKDATQALEGLEAGASPQQRELLALLWAACGQAQFAAERYGQAEAALRQALALDPALLCARLDLGFTLFNLSQTEAALAEFAAIPEDAAERAAAWRAEGAARLSRHEFAFARIALGKALARDPKDAEGWSLLVQLDYEQNDVAGRFRDWTRINLADPQARPNLLPASFTATMLDEVLDHCARVRSLDGRIRVEELGFRFLVAAGRPEAAQAFLRAEPAPDARTERLMADGAWLLGDLQAARTHYRQSLDLRCREPGALRPLGIETPPRPAPGTATGNGMPIIYVHWDAPDYLRLSAARSLISNPGSKVVMIGDSSNRFEGLDHVKLDGLAQGAADFQALYQHRSENDYSYELFCFQRWFFLRDWMRRENVPRLCALDSDVLLFAKLEELEPRIQGFDLAFAGRLGAHFAILTQAGIEALCDFFMELYAKPERLPAAPQLTDMLLLPHFLEGRGWADLGPAQDAQPVIDGNLRLAEGFILKDGLKAIAFDPAGQPWGQRPDGKKVRFAALHFQGTAKRRMKDYFFR